MQENTEELHSIAKTRLCACSKGVALLILIIFLIFIGSSLWENAPWNKENTGINLNRLYRFYVDPSNTLEADELLQKPVQEWRRPANEKMNFGFDSSTYWLSAHFQSTESGAYILEFPYSLLKSIEVFAFLDGTKTYHYKTGINRGFSSRPIAHRNFLFPLDLKENQQVSILIKVNSDGFLKIPSRLWRQEDFHKKDQVANLVQGAYFGTIAVVLIFNLLALLAFYNDTQFWFVIYGGLFFIFQTSMQGFGHQYFWPETPEYQNNSICITMIFGGLISCLFAHAFLELKRSHVKTNYVFLFFVFCMSVLLLAYPSFPYNLILRLQILINVVLGIFFIIIGISHWRKGNVETTIFILAWLLLVLSVLLDGVEKMGLVSNLAGLLNLSSDIEMLQLVSVIEVIFLSFALGDKINHDRKTSICAQQELIRVKSEQTQLLETSVDERTQELQGAIKELATVNEKLNSINNTDSLTGVFNRHFFIQYYEKWVEEHNKKVIPFSLILFDVDQFKKINDNYGHLYGDHCLITITDTMKSNLRENQRDYLCRYGGEEFALLLPCTDSDTALEIAERLRQAIEDQPVEYENIKSTVTVSAGVATTPTDQLKDGKWLFAMCDQALYKAKVDGRNKIVVHPWLNNSSVPL